MAARNQAAGQQGPSTPRRRPRTARGSAALGVLLLLFGLAFAWGPWG